jgi:competence protein ComEC
MDGAGNNAAGQAKPYVDSRYYLALVGGVGWMGGIWLASLVNLDVLLWLVFAVPLLVGSVWLWRRGRAGLALAFCGALALGGGRYIGGQIPFNSGYIHYYNGARDVILEGDVIDEPIIHDTRVQLRIAVRELKTLGDIKPVAGTIQIQTGRYPPIPYGATVRVEGDLAAPVSLGSPGYAAYLERQGVLSVIEFPRVEVLNEIGGNRVYRALLSLKARSREAIATALPEPHASLLTGILLGDSSGMPRELEEDFRETGMTHIIAISGFNIAVIIALLDYMTAPILPRRTATLAIMLFLGLYAVIVGAGESVVRAAIMGVSYLIGFRLLGRPTLAVAGLFTAAFLMTLATPNTLWDVGFQLSFAATLGLMVYAGPWTRRFSQGVTPFLAPQVRGRVTNWVADILLVTLAAQVLTMPLILFHFGRLSLASLPANVLVLPAQAAVMVTGGLTLLLGLISPAGGQIAGLFAWFFLNYTITVIRMLARMPAASIPLPLSVAGLVAVYLFIAAVSVYGFARMRDKHPVTFRMNATALKIASLVGVVLIGLLIIGWSAGRAENRLHVAFLDVGQGDAIFIQTPGGRQLLVDGGRYPSATLDELGRQMPFWDRSIDLVIATHPDADHIAGLVEVMERYEVSQLITNGADKASDTAYAAILEAAARRGTPVHAAQEGEMIILDEGVRLEILHSGGSGSDDDRNDGSVVGRLTYGELSVMLTGDAETPAESDILQDGRPLRAMVLKAGHHGANTSSSELFLQAVAPGVVVISVGRENSYGHPHPAMLERAAAIGAIVLRTDELGTLEMASDGARIWWFAEHEMITPIEP